MNDSNAKDLNLIWIDLEMTGLCPNNHVIIEIATVVTDPELNILATGPVVAVQQSAATMAAMDEWNTSHHGSSGLTARVLSSAFSASDAEQQTINFLKEWVPKGASPMCGNTICQDRRFLANYMPALEDYFHYRQIDVSSLTELARRWSPNILQMHKKRSSHLALDDVIDSINELKFLRKYMLSI